jgi:hypothetical protein
LFVWVCGAHDNPSCPDLLRNFAATVKFPKITSTKTRQLAYNGYNSAGFSGSGDKFNSASESSGFGALGLLRM